MPIGLLRLSALVDAHAKKGAQVRYSREWQDLSERMRKAYPLCLDPLKLHEGQSRPALEVHHLIPVKVDPSLELDPLNLVPCCRDCHEYLEALANRNPPIIPHPELIVACKENLLTFLGEGWVKPCGSISSVTSPQLDSREFLDLGGGICSFLNKLKEKNIIFLKSNECNNTNQGFYCQKLRQIKAVPCPGCLIKLKKPS